MAHEQRRFTNSDGVGDVFVWGMNDTGALGLTTRSTRRKRPFPVALLDDTSASGYQRLLPKCSHVAAGGVHSVAATKAGELFTWGAGDEGQLARPVSVEDVEGPAKPARVDVPQGAGEVVRVAASDAATFALDAHGSVYASGVFKDESELGLIPDQQEARVKAMAPFFLARQGGKEKRATTQLEAGNAHVAMLVEENSPRRGFAVYTAGSGAQGQLGRLGPRRFGLRGSVQSQLAPAPVRLPRGAGEPVAVFAGGWHTFVLTATGAVVGFGLNNWGQLGLPRSGDASEDAACVYAPRVIDALSFRNVVSIACGEHHSLALTAQGETLSFGRFAYGRLGRAMDTGAEARDRDAACPVPAPVVFPGKVRIARVAAGMSHSACVDDKGTLFVFGSGDGYMLGRGDDDADATEPVAVGTTEAYKRHWDPDAQKVSQVSLGGMHVMAIARPGY